MKKFGLATQIFIALILGILVGAVTYGNNAAIAYIAPIGDIFIHLIKMIVMPIVIAALVVAVAGVGDIKKLGKLGGKTILYFEIITTIALGIGLLAANVFHPGSGCRYEPSDKRRYLSIRTNSKRYTKQRLCGNNCSHRSKKCV